MIRRPRSPYTDKVRRQALLLVGIYCDVELTRRHRFTCVAHPPALVRVVRQPLP